MHLLGAEKEYKIILLKRKQYNIKGQKHNNHLQESPLKQLTMSDPGYRQDCNQI